MRSSRRSSPNPITALGLGISVVVAIAACSSGASVSGSSQPPTGAATGAATAAIPSPTAVALAPRLTDAWVRVPTGMATITAAYLTVTGGSEADAILSVSTPAASKATVHETKTDASGMTGMHPVSRIDVAAGATVKLEPGGYHVMLEGLRASLTSGQAIELDVVFEHAGTIVVQAVVRQP